MYCKCLLLHCLHLAFCKVAALDASDGAAFDGAVNVMLAIVASFDAAANVAAFNADIAMMVLVSCDGSTRIHDCRSPLFCDSTPVLASAQRCSMPCCVAPSLNTLVPT